MKIIKTLLLILFISACSNGQYNPHILEYRLKIFKISVIPDLTGFRSYTFEGDTIIQLRWQHYENNNPDWITPYARILHSTLIIINEEGLWGEWVGGQLIVGTDTTAYKTRLLSLDSNQWYEIVMTAYGDDTFNPRESGECKPIYIHVPTLLNKPYIILELRIND